MHGPDDRPSAQHLLRRRRLCALALLALPLAACGRKGDLVRPQRPGGEPAPSESSPAGAATSSPATPAAPPAPSQEPSP